MDALKKKDISINDTLGNILFFQDDEDNATNVGENNSMVINKVTILFLTFLFLKPFIH